MSAPDELTSADKVRLGAWVLDHEAHLLSHPRLLAGERLARLPGAAPLGERLAPLAPALPEPAEDAAEGPVAGPADA